MIKLLNAISKLLDYPQPVLLNHKQDLLDEIKNTKYLPPALRQKLAEQVELHLTQDIYDLQIRYDNLFDRGRNLSLLLFEHVHGESKDRGQAMVDLLNVYFDAGMQPRADELPDYLPLFLEFLATQDIQIAATCLFEVKHILQLLAYRLRKRQAWESLLFDALLTICDAKLEDANIAEKVSQEKDDTSLEAMDKAWEDKEIRFDEVTNNTQGCSQSLIDAAQLNAERPVIWCDTPKKNIYTEV